MAAVVGPNDSRAPGGVAAVGTNPPDTPKAAQRARMRPCRCVRQLYLHGRCTATCTGWRCAVATRWSLRPRGARMSATSATAGGTPSSDGSAKATSPPLATPTRRRPRAPSGASAHGTASISRGWSRSGARRSSTCGAPLAAVCIGTRAYARTYARTHARTHARTRVGTHARTHVRAHARTTRART